MAISEVNIPLSATGLKDVLSALKSIEQSINSLAIAKERSSRKGLTDAERAAKAEVRAADKAAQEQIRILQRTDKLSQAAGEKAVRDFDKQEERKRRILENSEKRKLDAIQRRIKQEAEAEKRAMAASKSAFANSVGSRMGYGVTRGLHAATGLATAALGVMGGFHVADAVRERANMHGLASAIAIQGSKEGGQKFTSKEVLNTATAEGVRSGRGTEEMLHGLQKFIDITGDLKAAQENIKMISTYADASGSSLADMATAAGELWGSGTVKNAKELAATLGTFTEMGKGGAIELKDFAKDFAKLTGSSFKFGGVTQSENVSTLGALAELGKKRGGAKGPIQAMTSVQAFTSDVTGNFAKIQSQLGIKLRDKTGHMRSAEDIVADVVQASGGKGEKLHGLFGRQGVRAIDASMVTYRKAIDNKATPKEARAAVVAEIRELSAKHLTEEQAIIEAGERRAEADRQFAMVTEKLKVAMGEQLLPVFLQMVPTITEMVPQLVAVAKAGADLAAWFTKNPFSGLGVLIGGFLLKELAIAFAGAKISQGVATAVGGGAGGIAALGAAGLAAGVSLAAGGQTVSNVFGAASDTNAKISGSIDEMGALALKIKTGKATPEDIAAAKKKMAGVKASINEANATGTDVVSNLGQGALSTLEGVAGMVGYKGTSERDEASRMTRMATVKESQDTLKASVDMLARVIQENTNSQKSGGVPALNNKNREGGMAERGGTH